MPYPPISALPAVPSRNAPSTFSALMDAFLAAFPQFRTDLNALAAYLDTLALATGPGLFQNGSAAAPGISWALDTNTGFFSAGADQIGFATGGVQRALLSAAGLQLGVPLTGSAVVGTASQSGGVSTGALIERGSNANGEYVRFADGTQICWSPAITSGAVNVASGALYTCNFAVWSFPAAFAAGTYPVVHGECKNSISWVVTNMHSTTSVSAGLMRTASAAAGLDYVLTAIGRWF